MGQPVPPELGLDALSKILGPGGATYVLFFLIQRRQLILRLGKMLYGLFTRQEEIKRQTQEHAAVNGNGNGQKTELVLLNLENVMARINDVRRASERDIAALSERQGRERKEWLDQIGHVNAEYAKLSHRLEVYKRDTDKEIAELKDFNKRVERDMRRGFDDVMEALRELKDAA